MNGERIHISGKSILRRTLSQAGPRPVHSASFQSVETYFSADVENGVPLVIQVGDGLKDKSRIKLEVRLIDRSGRPVQMPGDSPQPKAGSKDERAEASPGQKPSLKKFPSRIFSPWPK